MGAVEANDENARLAELRKVVTVALQPHVGDHADIVVHHARPISEKNGFSAEIYLPRLPADDAFVVQKVLNAGATLNYVQLDERVDQDGRYYLHKQLFKTLLLISSAAPRTGQRSRAPQLAPPEQPTVAHGGRLEQQFPALGNATPTQAALPSFLAPDVPQTGTPRTEPREPRTVRPDHDDRPVDMRQYFIDCMIEALGIHSEVYASIAGETWGAAQAASDAFKLVQRTNRMLDKIIDQRESAAQATVDQIYERLISTPQAQAPLGSSALDAAYDDVLKNLSIIALLPGGPVEREVRSLRAKLEKQFESDLARPTPEEEHLLALVRRLDDNIARNTRGAADDWRRMQLGFMQGPFAVYTNRAQRPGA